MESTHFYLVILDIEGKIVKFNHRFNKVNSNPIDVRFCDFLAPASILEFDNCLESMLESPKVCRQLMLHHGDSTSISNPKIWWEFSVVTTPEMDFSGIIGIGVDIQFLEQEQPWHSLVDVLRFGKILMDRSFRVQGWDDKILEWFDPQGHDWEHRPLMDTQDFSGIAQLRDALQKVSADSKAMCFLIDTPRSNQPAFASLLVPSSDGYHLFLVPKDPIGARASAKCLIPNQIFSALSGAVYVLDKRGKLSQQNEAAITLGRTWKGRAYSEGFALTFPSQANRFTKLLRAIEDARNGTSSDLELKLLMPDRTFSFWNAFIRPIENDGGTFEGIVIQVFELTELKAELMRVNRENERLRELALSPSHVLRGPLSSMIGLLELIDAKQLDSENRKLFSYLKPLTKELDQTIRKHAKKMSTFD